MKKFSNWISNHSLTIVFIAMILLVPTMVGYIKTRVNYDILVYLPEDVDTIKGQNVLKEDFKIGSYAFVMVENKTAYEMLELEEDIKRIDGVNQVFSIADVIGTTIPIDMLPDEVQSKLYKDNETIILVTFQDSISSDATIEAVRNVREVVKDASRVSSMTAMVIDTMDLSDQEFLAYVIIAVILCLVVLVIATNSYMVPILLLANIGVAILYNMGTNIFLGEISYITKAITAILQLGVTTDFSIFLYHKYQEAKNETEEKKQAMALAITETFKSVMGSSLTTFAGFLTLGTDIGIVMAKGVVCGLLCVLTLFPALLLVFDKMIEKTKHKNFLPKFERIQKFSVKHHIIVAIVFCILVIPACIGNARYEVYYKLDDSLPSDLSFQLANATLAEKFNIVSPEIIILDKEISSSEVTELIEEIETLDGIDFVISPSTRMESGMRNILPDDVNILLNNDKYQLILTSSTYEVASNELNEQIKTIEKMVKKYDENGMVAGEGALMKDLVTIADHDFKMVNYTSIGVIFVIMALVLKSISLPFILIATIEFAIFSNMAFAYFTSTQLPFVASIIVGTIQLGATIDYAILMSTRYLEERMKISDKKEAMKNTLHFTVPSIISSALCFFGATIGVALYTKIDMIGAICELLARGSIISMATVILVLPSLLMIFDKVIIKTTKIKEENKHENHK